MASKTWWYVIMTQQNISPQDVQLMSTRAIYCQDMYVDSVPTAQRSQMYRQTSFALGRPDSLGPDEYHNQSLPVVFDLDVANAALEDYVLQVVPSMVELSRIMRKVGLRLYADKCVIDERIARVQALETDLKFWKQGLPAHFQPVRLPTERSLKSGHSATYVKKQTVVLHLRMD